MTVKGVFNTELQYFAAIQDTDGTVYADIHATDVEADAVTFPVPELLPVQYPEEIEMFIGAYCRIDGVTLSVLKVPADGQVMLFSHADAFGSPVAMTNMNGDVVWERQYLPYGGEVASETFDDEIASVPINFTSHYKDDETGLVYMGARYYDTTGRRFISPDPVVMGAGVLSGPHVSMDWNPYIYSRANPYKYSDLTGRHPLAIIGGIAAAYVAVETSVDVSLTAYDGYHYVRAVSEGDADTAGELGWDLTMDIAGMISPAIPAGILNKVAKYGIELYDGVELGTYFYDEVEEGDVSLDTAKDMAETAVLIGLQKRRKGGKRETGSYTNIHESGKKYHGKGSRERMNRTGREKANLHQDPVVNQDWKPAANDREAFKDEARRIRTDDLGVKSNKNYNKINSPGEKFLHGDE